MYTSALYSSTAFEYFSAAFIAFFKIGSTGSSAKTLKVVEVNEYKNKKKNIILFLFILSACTTNKFTCFILECILLHQK